MMMTKKGSTSFLPPTPTHTNKEGPNTLHKHIHVYTLPKVRSRQWAKYGLTFVITETDLWLEKNLRRIGNDFGRILGSIFITKLALIYLHPSLLCT